MIKEEVLNSIQLKKRFCKDCGLPIVVFDNPYFMERLQTLDPLFSCVEKFNRFCNELHGIPDEQTYFAQYNEIKEKMIQSIKNNPKFQEFQEEIFTKRNLQIGKKNLYTPENDRGTFVSIDMKKANFSALHHYSKQIFDSCDTWEEFVKQFTDSAHISESKYIRQVVLGACNPGRQIKFESYLMSILYQHIAEHLNNLVFYSLGEDEIIITVDNPNKNPDNNSCDFSLQKLIEVVDSCPGGIGKLVRVQMFGLYKIGDYGYMKYDNHVEFKCVDAEIYHQIVKHFYSMPITENDLVFYHNGRLARFLKEVDNPWNTL